MYTSNSSPTTSIKKEKGKEEWRCSSSGDLGSLQPLPGTGGDAVPHLTSPLPGSTMRFLVCLATTRQ